MIDYRETAKQIYIICTFIYMEHEWDRGIATYIRTHATVLWSADEMCHRMWLNGCRAACTSGLPKLVQCTAHCTGTATAAIKLLHFVDIRICTHLHVRRFSSIFDRKMSSNALPSAALTDTSMLVAAFERSQTSSSNYVSHWHRFVYRMFVKFDSGVLFATDGTVYAIL